MKPAPSNVTAQEQKEKRSIPDFVCRADEIGGVRSSAQDGAHRHIHLERGN